MIDNTVDYLEPEEQETQDQSEVEETQEETQQQQPSQQQAKNSTESWKDLRMKAERADQLQRERDEYYALLRQLAENQKRAAPKEDDFDINSLPDDELLDGKMAKRLVKKQEQEKEQLLYYMKQQQQVSYENQVANELRGRYGDFDDVVNTSNIEKLKHLRPGIARTLDAIPDTREKAIEVYHTLKDMGIVKTNAYSYEQEKIQNNLKKPRSMSSVPKNSDDPLNMAAYFDGNLTDDARRAIYEDTLKKAGRK